MVEIAPAEPADLDEVRAMFREYSALVQEALCFQGFDAELAGLPGAYAPPAGALLVARDGRDGRDLAGCVALRRLPDGRGEMKRMYVRERHRGSGLGRRLALKALTDEAMKGTVKFSKNLMASLTSAIALYRSLGFREIPPYLPSPTPGALCFELSLS